MDWGRMNWDHSLLAMKLQQFDLMKLETENVKNDENIAKSFMEATFLTHTVNDVSYC